MVRTQVTIRASDEDQLLMFIEWLQQQLIENYNNDAQYGSTVLKDDGDGEVHVILIRYLER